MPMNVSSWTLNWIFKLWRIYRSHPSIKGLIHPQDISPLYLPLPEAKNRMSHRNALNMPTGSQVQRDGGQPQLWVSYSIPNRPFVSIFEMPFSTQDTFIEHLPCSSHSARYWVRNINRIYKYPPLS